MTNAVHPCVRERLYNIFEAPGSQGIDLWEREVRLLLRDSFPVRSLAERVLGQAVAYLITAMENPGVDMGPGFTVDVELWEVDASDCGPCDDKVPDSH
ncbi:hypothetical protein [Streptomyces sp. NPDC094437]|uniref:hypothetical protein n=1 Tax=Streptomyces sp. NPDC094437 TaxID=3366060 RepID=UPI00382B72BB